MNNPLGYTDPSGYCRASRVNTAKGSVCGGSASDEISQSQVDAVNGSNLFGAIASAKVNGALVGQGQTNNGVEDSADLNSQVNILNTTEGGNTSFHIEENFNTKFTGGNGTTHHEFTKELDSLVANESSGTPDSNAVGDVNRGVAIAGVSASLLELSKGALLYPKPRAIMFTNPRLNIPNIGVASSKSKPLIEFSIIRKLVAVPLAIAGVSVTVAQSLNGIRTATSDTVKQSHIIKGTLDLSLIVTSFAVGGLPGLAIAGSYLFLDYAFDIREMVESHLISGLRRGKLLNERLMSRINSSPPEE